MILSNTMKDYLQVYLSITICAFYVFTLSGQNDLTLMAEGETYFSEYKNSKAYKVNVTPRNNFNTPEAVFRYAVATDEDEELRQLSYNPNLEISFKLKKYFNNSESIKYSDYSVDLINKFVRATSNGDSLAFIKYNVIFNGSIRKIDVLELIYLSEKKSWYLWNEFNDNKYRPFTNFLALTKHENVLYMFTGVRTSNFEEELEKFMARTRIGGYFDYEKYRGLYFSRFTSKKLKSLLQEPFISWK